MAQLTLNAPVSGGIVPGGLLGNQLAAITRRAIAPVVFTQIYQATPLLSMLFSTAQRVRGGVPQITFPVQGSSFVQFAWGGFGGDFEMPSDQAAIQNAQFTLKFGMVPIGFFGIEAIIQSSEVVVPKLRAVTSDAAVVMKQAISQALYANNYSNPQALDSLSQAYDDGTNVPSYGGITRAGNQFWHGQYIPNAGAIANRVGVATALTRVMTGAGGESPDFAVMNPANWATLMADYMGYEQYMTRPRSIYDKNDVVNAGFRAIRVLDTPVFPDPFCPLGTMYMINSRYAAAHISESAAMVFSGFESTIPQGQIANIGVLITALDFACAKPSSGAQFTGIAGAAWPSTPGSTPAVI